ncbi:phasin family protein [Candidatus Albibeggiatoa sp. nov. NOAA]|uniref:phasin family protein n=1 Tax=Candidatus Albibeggiatoa sp. nov. NOAA TaxID=3162724 RepID=UPI0032F38F81|nr:phasin family protein [Thiotrichaceae bacterium]
MQAQFMEQFAKAGQQSLENAKKFAELNNAFYKGLTQQQVDTANNYVENANQHASKLGEAKRVQDVVTVQTQFIQEANKIAMGNARTTLDMMIDAKNQFVAWYEDSVKEAAEYIPAKAAAK